MRGSKYLTAGLGLSLLTTSLVGIQAQATSATETRPNILVIYMDDVSENERRLWCNENKTPALAMLCTQGVEFRNAVGSTPLCGPARAQLLTGGYGHRTGVTENHRSIGYFNPSETVATNLQSEGYYTLYAGKYNNGIAQVSRQGVRRYAQGWNKFDVIWQRTTSKYKEFYNYRLWTKGGVFWKGRKPQDHSTRMAATRLARHIRNAPNGKPVFALASLYSGHAPNIAMARHIGDKRCRNVAPWNGPSYMEKDVSDKPLYVRKMPRYRLGGYDLTKKCQEMLSVNWALGKIKKALKDTGRYDNTLIIFTSDNGALLGDHRKPGGKRWPYAAPVHLHMSWPAVLGNKRRVVTEPVSNVDLAPTLCAIAGCKMPGADGRNILPLIRGISDKLNRKFVYVENLHPWNGMPPWYGLHTTKSYSEDAYWVYTELKTGERELYNITKDPYQLNNLAGRAWVANRVKELHDMLHAQVIKPNNVRFK